MLIRSFVELCWRKRRSYTINKDEVKSYRFLESKNKHVFFSYYDLPQVSADGSKMLVHVVGKHADPSGDQAEIGYYDLQSGEYHKLTSTDAWCWQLGARLRWHPLSPDKVLYNDVSDSNYVTKVVDINIAKPEVLTTALYDLSSDFKHGVGLNFSRLQRLRPGYGYSILPDLTIKNRAPDDDGLFLVDLENQKSELIVSLHEISLSNDPDLQYEHYFNHVSFCPDGTKFIFYHIAYSRITSKRITQLYLYDLVSGMMELLDDNWIPAHYCWRNENELMTPSVTDSHTLVYVIYNLLSKSRCVIDFDDFLSTGHPSFFKSGNDFIIDEYPDRNNYQVLYRCDLSANKASFISEFYHKPQKSHDMRCDLHPRLWEDESKAIITLDTTCVDGLRRVALLELHTNRVAETI